MCAHQGVLRVRWGSIAREGFRVVCAWRSHGGARVACMEDHARTSGVGFAREQAGKKELVRCSSESLREM